MSRCAKYKSLKYKELREILNAHYAEVLKSPNLGRSEVEMNTRIALENAIREIPKTPEKFVGDDYAQRLRGWEEWLYKEAFKDLNGKPGQPPSAKGARDRLIQARILAGIQEDLKRKT
jgi:hypothetical protein